ncbi:MAG: hypothetical protein QNJ98_15760 [Planctomycetota bacterium]|nr:hypothetical protein [Planctomycetota bacterium]
MKTTPAPVRLLATTALLLLLVTPASADAFKDARKQYRDYLKRPSLFMRTRGRKILARTKDVRALELLRKSYPRSEAPKDQVRYLIATIAANNINGVDTVSTWDAFRAKNKKDRDAWLWFRALRVHLKHKGPQALKQVALGKENVFLRMAAVEALIETHLDDALALVPAVLGTLPEAGIDRVVTIETCIGVLFAAKDKLGTEAYDPSLQTVIELLDHEATPKRTKLVIVRRLAKIFGTDVLDIDAQPWLLELKKGKTEGAEDDARYAPDRPTFIGIQATGDRIAYVIDMSDSMLTPLTGKEKEDLKGPITGPGAERRDRDGIDWDAVETRFDAARAFLKASLLRLKEDKSFCVIFFGTEAARMASSPGLVQANTKNVQKVIKELDAIEAGLPNRRRPHGTLRGNTNIHGGMHRAFKLHGTSLVKAWEYVDARTFLEGCDAIFLLSDGAPTMDDWAELDKRDPQDRGGDPEMRRGGAQPPQLLYFGPYAQPGHLVDDIHRLNLFRKAEIHCIGMGEARMPLLKRIATLGLGKARKIGEPPADDEEEEKKDDEEDKGS